MNSIEDSTKPASWSRDPLSQHHIPAHAPMQVTPRPQEAQNAAATTAAAANAFAVAMQPQWQFPAGMGTVPSPQQQQMFRPSWPPANTDWSSAGNPVVQHGNPEWNWAQTGLSGPVSQLSLLMAQNQQIPQNTLMQELIKNNESKNMPAVSMNEDEHRSSETHTASYDNSASQSPEKQLGVVGEEDHHEDIDVESTNTQIKQEITEGDNLIIDELQTDDQMETGHLHTEVKTEKTPSTTDMQMDEASRLLLSLSQQSFLPPSEDNPSIISYAPLMEQAAQKIDFARKEGGSAFTSTDSTNTVISQNSQDNNSSVCRPPGLGPVNVNGNGGALVCPICGFSCPSKFHYNSHMNTHGDHQCSMCDYTSRTEGRLKKHMRESHTIEQQIAAGLDPSPPRCTTPPTSATVSIMTTTPLTDTSALSTTMASIVNVANAVAAATSEPSSSLAGLLGMDPNTLSGAFLNVMAPSTIDQLRALAEKSSFLSNGSLNLESLGVFNHFAEEETEKKEKETPPRRSSGTKPKRLKCRQCPHISFTKDDQWDHSRTHIPIEKQLNCEKCKFVTEYKHHLEYHQRNHNGTKPFQCKKCSYQCVNKSMLNSHMKSHTNTYQFRCLDCTYATKYSHSLKLHLQKYEHRRVPEGMNLADLPPIQNKPIESPNTSTFGTQGFRPPVSVGSGPQVSTLAQSLGINLMPPTSQSLNYASEMLIRQHQMNVPLNDILSNLGGLGAFTGGLTNSAPTPVETQTIQLNCSICEYKTLNQDELMRHQVNHIIANNAGSPMVSLYQPQVQSLLPAMQSLTTSIPETTVSQEHQVETQSGHTVDDEMEGGSGSSATTGSPVGASDAGSTKNESGDEESRKKKQFRVDQIGDRLSAKSPAASEDDEHHEHMESSVSPVETASLHPSFPIPTTLASAFAQIQAQDNKLNLFQQACLAQLNNVLQGNNNESFTFQCHHCRLAFKEQALYQIHMGLHGYEHAFKCNGCGFTAKDSIDFNLHLLRVSHE